METGLGPRQHAADRSADFGDVPGRLSSAYRISRDDYDRLGCHSHRAGREDNRLQPHDCGAGAPDWQPHRGHPPVGWSTSTAHSSNRAGYRCCGNPAEASVGRRQKIVRAGRGIGWGKTKKRKIINRISSECCETGSNPTLSATSVRLWARQSPPIAALGRPRASSAVPFSIP